MNKIKTQIIDYSKDSNARKPLKMGFECGICMEAFNDGRETIVTKCGHMFHLLCTNQWLTTSKTCPQCRKNVLKTELRTVFIQTPEKSKKKFGCVTRNQLAESKTVKILKDRLKEAEDMAEGYRFEAKHFEDRLKYVEKERDLLREENAKLKRLFAYNSRKQ